MSASPTEQEYPLILVVDDDRAMRLVLRRVMEQEGYQVVEATDGEECLAAYIEQRPNIVLMDGIMPVMDGFTACAEIRALPDGEQTPVLMITSLDDNASVDRAFEVGANDFVTKPIHWAVLRQRVRRLLHAQRTEVSMRESERTLATLLSNLPGMAYRRRNDLQWTMEVASEGTVEMTGYQVSDLIGSQKVAYASLIHPDDQQRVHAEIQTALRDQRPFRLIYRITTASGAEKWVWEQGRAVVASQAGMVALEGFVTDISERKAVEEQLTHQAFHDPLTGLPNRSLFMDRLEHALARAVRRTDTIALLFMDLDHFKIINDTLGHKAGDLLLTTVGERIQECLRPGDTVARFGGDEFTLLLEGISYVSDATLVAERIAEALIAPINLEGREVVVTTSIGIVLNSFGGVGADDLLRNADLALYEAKSKGKARYAVFDPEMSSRAWDRLELETELRQGIERGELRLYYQPVVDLATGRTNEVEALVRWQHPQRGLLAPGQFIPVAEETGLILKVGQWVLETACHQARAWQIEHPAVPPLSVSVNLSARQLQHPQLVEQVAQTLCIAGLDPCRLKLEITESVMMEHEENTITTLLALKALGVKLVVDDFGIGFSALSTLKRFPIDMLKIDRSFVAGIGRNAADTAIVRAVIGFASALNLGVTAEGIETVEQLDELRALGCDRGQGYYFDRPQPADVFARLFEQPLLDQAYMTPAIYRP